MNLIFKIFNALVTWASSDQLSPVAATLLLTISINNI